MTLTAILTPAEEGGLVAFHPETSTASQGETTDGALANRKEAAKLYLKEFPVSLGSQTWVTTFAVDRAQAAADQLPSVQFASDATMITRECSGNLTAGSSGRTNPFSTIPATASGCRGSRAR
jgi:predicted RNase H-like HicB family nuclease